jgi:glutamate-1-semialdehyde 2,1-aminomutase
MMKGFGITEYHDTKEIYNDLYALLSLPVRSIRKEALAGYLSEYYEKKCPKSKAMIDKAVKYIPGGVQHNLAFHYPFPPCCRRGLFLSPLIDCPGQSTPGQSMIWSMMSKR